MESTTVTICSPAAPAIPLAAAEQDCRRRYAPSVWGDFFITYQPCTLEELHSMQEKARAMKKEVRRTLLAAADASGDDGLVRKLELVDALQRLGVDYHYEEEIDALLRAV
jgi:(-)-germacrene D synthase